MEHFQGISRYKTQIIERFKNKTMKHARFKPLLIPIMLNLLSCVTAVSCESHRLTYYHTGVLHPGTGNYSFISVGYVDDQQIDEYNSNSKLNVPTVYWMKNKEDPNYWERQTYYRRGWEKVLEDNLNILKNRLNNTSESITLQHTYGCEIRDDGSTIGHYEYGLNGKEFLYLDQKYKIWMALSEEGKISTQRWNTDQSLAESVEVYLTKRCPDALKKYVDFGKADLEKRVRPEVKVWGHQSERVTKLHCHVYRFHPRPVVVKWMKNRQDEVPSSEMMQILPNPDGTYQTRVTVEVPDGETDTYCCHVEHSSLEEELNIQWERNRHHRTRRLLYLVCLLLTVITLLCVALYLTLHRPKIKQHDKDDQRTARSEFKITTLIKDPSD